MFFGALIFSCLAMRSNCVVKHLAGGLYDPAALSTIFFALYVIGWLMSVRPVSFRCVSISELWGDYTVHPYC